MLLSPLGGNREGPRLPLCDQAINQHTQTLVFTEGGSGPSLLPLALICSSLHFRISKDHVMFTHAAIMFTSRLTFSCAAFSSSVYTALSQLHPRENMLFQTPLVNYLFSWVFDLLALDFKKFLGFLSFQDTHCLWGASQVRLLGFRGWPLSFPFLV